MEAAQGIDTVSHFVVGRKDCLLLRDDKYLFSPNYILHHDGGYHNVSEGQKLFCIRIATYRIDDNDLEHILGLVMREVGYPPKYERIGLAEFEPGSVLDSWYEKYGTLRTITII